jgi:hypothetical protein
MTAVGTVAVAVVAVWVALWTERRAARRLGAEHERSDRLLEDERRHSRAQIEEERRIAREREQLAEAYQVQVVMGQMAVGEPDEYGEPDVSMQRLAVMVLNRGPYTITRVEARFIYDGKVWAPRGGHHGGYTRLPGFLDLPEMLRAGWKAAPERAMYGVLTPWDTGIRFESGEVHIKLLPRPYPLVRWTDRLGTRWEHRRGEVRQVRDDEDWTP